MMHGNRDFLLGEDYERCGEVRLSFDRTVFERNPPYRCTADLVIFNLELLDRSDEPAWQNLVRKRDGTADENSFVQQVRAATEEFRLLAKAARVALD